MPRPGFGLALLIWCPVMKRHTSNTVEPTPCRPRSRDHCDLAKGSEALPTVPFSGVARNPIAGTIVVEGHGRFGIAGGDSCRLPENAMSERRAIPSGKSDRNAGKIQGPDRGVREHW